MANLSVFEQRKASVKTDEWAVKQIKKHLPFLSEEGLEYIRNEITVEDEKRKNGEPQKIRERKKRASVEDDWDGDETKGEATPR